MRQEQAGPRPLPMETAEVAGARAPDGGLRPSQKGDAGRALVDEELRAATSRAGASGPGFAHAVLLRSRSGSRWSQVKSQWPKPCSVIRLRHSTLAASAFIRLPPVRPSARPSCPGSSLPRRGPPSGPLSGSSCSPEDATLVPGRNPHGMGQGVEVSDTCPGFGCPNTGP